MGLDVDIYRVKKEKGKTEENYLDEVIYDKKYIETIYMRKPYLIWFDMNKFVHLHCGILKNNQIKKIKLLLEDIIRNFKKEYLREYCIEEQAIDFDSYVYHLKKYVDFYSIITNYNKDEEYLILDYCA